MASRLQRTPVGTIVPIAGQRVYNRLINAVQSHYWEVTLSATVTIAVAAAAAILNRGSLLAAFDEVGIDENGTERWNHRGTVARYRSDMVTLGVLPKSRLTSTAIGATTLRETIRLYPADPFAANPRETAYREHDTRQLLQLFMTLAASGGADRIATAGGGGGTVTLTNIKCNVVHRFDASETALPYFIPIVKQQIVPVAGANALLQSFIKTTNAVRAFIVSQETSTVGEVSDIINGIRFVGDQRNIIGPAMSPWTDEVDSAQFNFQGSVQTYAHLGINLQEHGRLAAVLNPNQDVNMRFEFDCQPSASAGNSFIRITSFELVADPQLCAPLDFPV